jgi:hypothetical protein
VRRRQQGCAVRASCRTPFPHGGDQGVRAESILAGTVADPCAAYGYIPRRMGKTKKEQNRIILFHQLYTALAKKEQKRYIFTKLTGLSGLH